MTTTDSTTESTASTQKPKHTDLASKSFDAIVIGSGMGGMACASALAKFGRKVLVLEQHYVAGGFTHTFSRKGFTWDVGVHCVGEMEENRIPGKILKWLTEGQVKMQSLGSPYDFFVFPDGLRVNLPDNSKDFRAELLKHFPEEKEAIEKYLTLVREAANSVKTHLALRFLPMWAEKLLAPIVRRTKLKWWGKTTKEVLDSLTNDERLKGVLAGQWGYYGSVPSRSSFAMHAVTARHFWNGGYYPVGGAEVLSKHILAGVTRTGGEVRTRAGVETILMEGGRAVGVRLKEGTEVRAPLVISAANAKTTVSEILPEEIKERAWAKEIAGLTQSPCHICLHIGTEGDLSETEATLANHWYMETYDMEWADWDVADPKSIAPVLYVSFPSLKDPAHDGGPTNRQTGEVVTFVPWDAFEKWSQTRRGLREKDYMAFKKDIEERLVAQLKKHLPKYMSKVVFHEMSTPLSTTFFTRSFHGGIYGIEPTPARFAATGLRPKTPVKGLYLTGSDVGTLGVVGAMVGGIFTAASIEPKVFGALGISSKKAKSGRQAAAKSASGSPQRPSPERDAGVAL
ncbi:MAG: NAD(P)/FAD-dependent oxidoreductase [Bdellovibrionales bacterium]|nr:NAD(P)/FAD-dependent oxidoreductase [Bdellovibrionales bacterium]